MSDNPVVVGIAQGLAVCRPKVLVTYALGSCVGVCLYDRTHHIAGMAHILLPETADSIRAGNPYKFADSGCAELLRAMERLGANRYAVQAKLAGGARMFERYEAAESIGERNVKAVKAALEELGIAVAAEDTGKNYGRTILFDSEDGSLKIKSKNSEITII